MKSIALTFAMVALAFSGFATTTRTETISVPGKAKSVATTINSDGSGSTHVDCDAGQVCYTKTTTYVVELSVRQGDKTVVRVQLEGQGLQEITGGWKGETGGILPNGLIQHTITLFPTWTEY